MPVTEAALTSGASGTDATSYATASIAPTANNLVLAACLNADNEVPVTPTASGGGLSTWVEVRTVTLLGPARRRLTVFRGLSATPTSGALTFDFAGNTQLTCSWSVAQFENVDLTGTNGSGAVVQSVPTVDAFGTSITMTLAAFGSANNATYGAVIIDDSAEGQTPGGGFTEIHDVPDVDPTLANVLFTEWRNDNDTTVDESSASSLDRSGIAVEIKFAAAAAAGTHPGWRQKGGWW